MYPERILNFESLALKPGFNNEKHPCTPDGIGTKHTNAIQHRKHSHGPVRVIALQPNIDMQHTLTTTLCLVSPGEYAANVLHPLMAYDMLR